VSGRGAAGRISESGTQYAARHAAGDRAPRRRPLNAVLGLRGIGRPVAQTAASNIAVTVAGALCGIIIARVTGATVRGEYTAVTSWFGVALLLGEVGQPIALCYYVAQDPKRASQYLGTSRAIMVATGLVALAAGMALAPVLSHGRPELTLAYRIAFGCLLISCLDDSYTWALMSRALQRWNKARLIQPLAFLATVAVLWRVHLLALDAVLMALAGSLLVQLGWSYWSCRRAGLLPGRLTTRLVKPLTVYGVTQIAALAPATVNGYLDQLVLSVTVPPADLGHYSVAVSITLLPAPLVSAIGYVLLPRLAAQEVFTAGTGRLQRNAVLVSAGLAAVILLPIALASPWLVPLVFGATYRGAIPLVWILTPGGIFLSCGQVVANLLRGRGRQMAVARAEGAAVIFTLALLAALLPVLGVTGAAIASTVPYGISLALMIRSLRRISILRETDEGTP
jgi:O-antigen/teichoic acid export membrane protein